MSTHGPPVARKPSGVKVMMTPGTQLPAGLPLYTNIPKDVGISEESNHSSGVDAEREVELLNHCFDDVERFMSRLQQTAEAQSVLNQRKKKRSNKKSKKKLDQKDDLLTMKASPPSQDEFVHLFQKFKYSFCLLDRLKSSISQPSAPELLHHIFVPLRLMINTTGGPALAATVVSPAMTSGAVSLLQEHLTEEEKGLWTSLGSNWTSSRSQLSSPVPSYTPVFLDGWQPASLDSAGQTFEDPIEAQHKQEAYSEHLQALSLQEQSHPPAQSPGIHTPTHEVDGNGLPPEGERLYCCSYDFVARNSSELSVLQGETLEVVESSKRWWKCRNRYDQIGFVPFNILEPLSAVNNSSEVRLRDSKKPALTPRTKCFSYTPTSPVGMSPLTSPTLRPQSMVLPSSPLPADDSDRVLIMNDELLQRLAEKRGSVRTAVTPQLPDMSTPLDYHSPASEVKAWLTAKGFNQQTAEGLGILTGAQLFSLNKEELRTVSPEEGARVYSQIMMQKGLLEDVRKASELEKAMEKQKLKIALDS